MGSSSDSRAKASNKKKQTSICRFIFGSARQQRTPWPFALVIGNKPALVVIVLTGVTKKPKNPQRLQRLRTFFFQLASRFPASATTPTAAHVIFRFARSFSNGAHLPISLFFCFILISMSPCRSGDCPFNCAVWEHLVRDGRSSPEDTKDGLALRFRPCSIYIFPLNLKGSERMVGFSLRRPRRSRYLQMLLILFWCLKDVCFSLSLLRRMSLLPYAERGKDNQRKSYRWRH